jgi:hypothetical protein
VRIWMFMLIVDVIAAAMIPVTPSEFRIVNFVCIGLASLWAILYAAEDFSRHRRGQPTPRQPEKDREDVSGALAPPPRRG